jgi:hypothetical protein
MKSKIIFALIIIALIFGAYWLLNHAYVIVTFWSGMIMLCGAILLFFLGIGIGRITKKKDKPVVTNQGEVNTPPTQPPATPVAKYPWDI